MSDTRPGVPRLEGAELLGDVLGEALDPQDQHQHQHQQPPAAAPARQPAAPGDYYANLIAERRREFKALSDKLTNHETNRAYVKTDAQGNEYINFPQMTADQARLTTLKQEIDDYREESEKRRQTASQRFETARVRALAYARAETVKVPENLRKLVAEKFIDLFNGVSDNRIWERARYAQASNIDLDIQQLWESAVGSVTRSAWGGGAAPAPTGLDGQPPAREPAEQDEDPFVNNLMYAHQQRKARSMTFAEAKAAQRQAQQQPEGGVK